VDVAGARINDRPGVFAGSVSGSGGRGGTGTATNRERNVLLNLGSIVRLSGLSCSCVYVKDMATEELWVPITLKSLT
jgi:hypothetical protein